LENNKQLIALSSMSVGQKAQIIAFTFDAAEGERVQEVGISPGEQFEVMRYVPLEETIEIKIRGYFVSIRKQAADHIMVKLFS